MGPIPSHLRHLYLQNGVADRAEIFRVYLGQLYLLTIKISAKSKIVIEQACTIIGRGLRAMTHIHLNFVHQYQ